MRNNVLYKTIDRDTLKLLKPHISNIEVFDENNMPLDVCDEDGLLIIKDKNEMWVPGNGIKIEFDLVLENVQACIDNDIISSSDKVGITAMVYINNKMMREVIDAGVTPYNEKFVFHFKKFFDKGFLFNDVRIVFYLYLKNTLKNNEVPNYMHAQDVGSMLGEIADIAFAIDGSGSDLTISYYEGKKSDPLWKLEFSIDDINNDIFCEKYGLFINTNNERFVYLDKTSDSFNRALLDEIMAHSMVIVYNMMCEKSSEIIQPCGEGTTAQLYTYIEDTYMKNVGNIDLNKVSCILRDKLYDGDTKNE